MDWISIALERAGAATLEQFQTGHSLVPTGKLEPETMEALLPYLYGYLVWRIEKGDTFFKIAQRFGTTVKQILAANPQMAPNRLPVGELVTIPLPFSVVPTDVPHRGASDEGKPSRGTLAFFGAPGPHAAVKGLCKQAAATRPHRRGGRIVG